MVWEQDKRKSLERAGSVTGEVMLCSGLVDAGGAHRIIVGYIRNLILSLSLSTPHLGHTLVTDNHINTNIQSTEFVGSRKEPTWG